MMRPVSITYEIPEEWKLHFDCTKDADCLDLANVTRIHIQGQFKGFIQSCKFKCDSNEITLHDIKWGGC